MKLTCFAIPLVALIACGRNRASTIDARSSDGATSDSGGTVGSGYAPMCAVLDAKASCTGSTAAMTLTFGGGSTTHTRCMLAPQMTQATCAAGCAVNTSLEFDTSSLQIGEVPVTAGALCAEAAESVAGDACTRWAPPYDESPTIPVPCLTRAHVAADGTVTGQNYLRCDATSQRCVDTSAPDVTGYLTACDAQIVAQYGVTNAVGLVDPTPMSSGTRPVCLIAWDTSANATTSGRSIACIGDWECPASSLCDDQIPSLSAVVTPPVAVCKPGPRGTLTSAMLSP